MADDNDDKQTKKRQNGQDSGQRGREDGLDSMLPKVSEDRPLDGLVPEMSGDQDAGPPAGAGKDAPERAEPIHPRVLEVGLEEGTEWNLACWQDPGPTDFNDQVRRMVRATLLREFSRSAVDVRRRDKRFIGMRLMDFEGLGPDSRQALEAIGFEQQTFRPDQYSERMAAWREEARPAGITVGHSPESMWHLPIERRGGTAGGALETAADEMAEAMGQQVWGQTPGAMSRHLARALEEEMDVEIELGLEGLDALQSGVFPEEHSVIRWAEPLIFQGVCDFVGVVLHGKYGIRVQWGVCEPGADGIVPPPMFRLQRDGHAQTIPVGARVLEWCVLPLAPDDDPSTLSERVEQLARILGS